ncbi:hypothetical protein D3C71_368600 [compost metagenome]
MDAAAAVQRREGFIQQQQIRLCQQGPPQGHPLTLATGKPVGGLPQQIGKAEPHRQRLGLPAPSPLARRQLQIAQYRHVGKEAGILEHQPDAARLRQQGRQIPPLPVQDVRGGTIQPGDDAQQGTLATAGRAKEAENATKGECQIAVEFEAAKPAPGLEVQAHPNNLRCRRCKTP